jgi:hypothetical protein
MGGTSDSELIVFQTKAALERFQHGRLDFAADASAVIAPNWSVDECPLRRRRRGHREADRRRDGGSVGWGASKSHAVTK